MPVAAAIPGNAGPISSRQGCRWLLGWLKSIVSFFAWLAILQLLVCWIGLRFVGHHNPTTAFLQFLPSWLWSIPCLIMVMPGLVASPLRAGLPLLGAVLLYLGPGLGYQLRATPSPSVLVADNVLRVLTYNRGQSQGTSLQPFKNTWQPDLLALQDSGGRAQAYLEADGYQEFSYGDSAGEFLLLSKHPIINARLLVHEAVGDGGEPRQVALGARFEIDWRGHRVAVYNVHLPTHRGMLLSERNGGFIAGVVGLPGTPLAPKRHHREAYWKASLAQAQWLAQQVRQESLPTIAVGDFNNPPFGPFYASLREVLDDGHVEAGHGYGYSFPGSTNNPLALFRPWLRIDYVFHSKGHWRARNHVTEPARTSQHRAVFAELALTSSPDA